MAAAIMALEQEYYLLHKHIKSLFLLEFPIIAKDKI